MTFMEKERASRRSFIRKLAGFTAAGAVAGIYYQKGAHAGDISVPTERRADELKVGSTIVARYEEIQQSASYTVFIDGSTVKAKNGVTGEIDFSGSDASTVINNALGVLTSGGSLFIKRGSKTYSIASKISIRSDGISILGDYPRIRLADSVNDDMLEVAAGQKDILIEGLDLDGNRDKNTAGRLIHVLGNSGGKSQRATVAKNRIHDFITQGIRLESSSLDCQVLDNEVRNGGMDGILLMWGDHYRTKVLRNSTIDCEYGVGVSQCYGAMVAYNHIYNSTWAGIMFDGPSSKCVISNNLISGGMRDGMLVTIGGADSSPGESTIVGNLIENMGDNGIRITDLQNCLVANNTILNCANNGPNRYGILLGTAEGSIGVRDCLFLGNFIKGRNHTSAIKSASDHYNNTFIANWLRDNAIPIDLLSTWNKCFLNEGYNFTGTPTPVSLGSSPFEYYSGMRPETVYIQGGVVSEIKIGESILYTDTGHSVELAPKQSVKVSYSAAPIMFAQVH